MDFSGAIKKPLQMFGLDPSQGYDTASAGAKQAQAQANALSGLQWQRQMQGLAGAMGSVDALQSLYNSLYSPGGGKMAAGGRGPQQPGLEAMAAQPPPSMGPPPGPPDRPWDAAMQRPMYGSNMIAQISGGARR